LSKIAGNYIIICIWGVFSGKTRRLLSGYGRKEIKGGQPVGTASLLRKIFERVIASIPLECVFVLYWPVFDGDRVLLTGYSSLFDRSFRFRICRPEVSVNVFAGWRTLGRRPGLNFS